MGTGTSSHGRERGQGGNRGHSKHTHDKEGNIEEKEKKRKSEVESVSSLKKLNEELKEKLKKQGRAADKMGEEYSKLRGKLRKCKREKEDLEAEIETLKQRNKDLAMMVGSGDLLKDCQAESVEERKPELEKQGAKESNSTLRDAQHGQSLMAEVQKLKVKQILLFNKPTKLVKDVVRSKIHFTMFQASMKKVFGDAMVNGTQKTAAGLAKPSGFLKEDVKDKLVKCKEVKDAAMKKEETAEGMVQCQKCGKAVKQKSLIHHDRAVHLNQTRFDCDMCPYKCYFSSSLKEHKKGHGRKEGSHKSKFSCHLCTFSTPVSGSFAKHMKGHETDARHQKKQQDQG